MIRAIDINADLGEGFPNDSSLLDLVTSASISCGAHAGDPETIQKTLMAAKELGVPVGAHPGYPDREQFGRQERAIEDSEVSRLIAGQFEHLERLASRVGVSLRFVKPHGALYNQAQRDELIALGVVLAVRRLGLPLLGQPGSVLERLARSYGVRYITEGFPDRRYQADGRLLPRSRPEAMLRGQSEIDAQVAWLVQQGVETLCVHGDEPGAVENGRSVRLALDRYGIEARFWARADTA